MTWDRSADNGVVAGYKIYRDGNLSGFSQTNSFENSTVEPAAVYAYNISAYDTALNESPLTASLQVKTPEPGPGPDLLGYWKFDERRGVAVIDSSGCGNDATVVGPKRTPVTTGYALDFDGRDDYVEIAGSLGLDNLEAVTMAAVTATTTL